MFCGNCGNEIKEGASFCNNCGAPQNNAKNETSADAKSIDNQPSVSSDNHKSITTSDVLTATGKGVRFTARAIIYGAAGLLILLVLIVLIIFGIEYITHGKLDVKEVQKAYLEDYDDETIGDAFGNYSFFSDVSWSMGKENYYGYETDIVVLDATIQMYDTYNCQYTLEPVKVEFKRDDSFDIELLKFIVEGHSFFSYSEDYIVDCIYNDVAVQYDSRDSLIG
jgi:hypothetical protein